MQLNILMRKIILTLSFTTIVSTHLYLTHKLSQIRNLINELTFYFGFNFLRQALFVTF